LAPAGSGRWLAQADSLGCADCADCAQLRQRGLRKAGAVILAVASGRGKAGARISDLSRCAAVLQLFAAVAQSERVSGVAGRAWAQLGVAECGFWLLRHSGCDWELGVDFSIDFDVPGCARLDGGCGRRCGGNRRWW
jgi:hypothetical protein